LARDALFQSEMRNLVMTRMKMPACVDRGYTNINLTLQMDGIILLAIYYPHVAAF
jgi:hypothetical protein